MKRDSHIPRRAVLIPLLVVALLSTSLALLLTTRSTPRVHASPASSITLTTAIQFGPHANHGTFVASAPLCPSGTFVDEFETTGGGPSPEFTALLHKTLTCDDGSGTFTIQFHAHFPRNATGGSTPWAVLSGTGAYATLHGSGTLTFVSTGPTTAAETLTGQVHFD
jgi:hypothetical protein